MNATILKETTITEDNFTACQVLVKCRPAYLDYDFVVAEVSFDPVKSSWFVDLHGATCHGTVVDDTPLEGSDSGTVDFRGVFNRLGYSVTDGRTH